MTEDISEELRTLSLNSKLVQPNRRSNNNNKLQTMKPPQILCPNPNLVLNTICHIVLSWKPLLQYFNDIRRINEAAELHWFSQSILDLSGPVLCEGGRGLCQTLVKGGAKSIYGDAHKTCNFRAIKQHDAHNKELDFQWSWTDPWPTRVIFRVNLISCRAEACM